MAGSIDPVDPTECTVTIDESDPVWALKYILQGLSPQHQVIEPGGIRYWLSSEILDAANEQVQELANRAQRTP